MTLLYASTFARSLDRLTAAEQKQAKVTTVDLMLDPTGNGLQLHRVEKTEGFWTARVSQDIRIVLHKEGERTLLAWVDHHDAAYRWAERRRLVPHERTGAMQFVEVVEADTDFGGAAPPDRNWVPMPPGQRPIAEPELPDRPFAALTEDQLLDVGVPRDWLAPVRAALSTEVDELFAHLPDEAAEALLDVATGGRIEDRIAAQAQVAAHPDPYAHPDAQRRFREVAGVDELRAALDAPWAEWAVFLHPAQRAPVERAWRGPARVSGSAGTGKTIVALHRAAHLARDADARVLLTTFSKPLAANLAAKAELLTAATPDLRARLTVSALDQTAYELFASRCGQPNLATPAQLRAAIAAVVALGGGGGHSIDFLVEEWEEVVDAWQLHDAEGYAAVPRLGRKTRLGPKQRASAWAVFSGVRERLLARRLTTWADVYGRLTEWLDGNGPAPFTHVVVDEAQDLSVAQARFLAALGRRAGGADALFFTGDLGQRIFHLPFSWAKLGIDVRGRGAVLRVCYRTSHQIRSAADRLLAREIVDGDGIAETRTGTVSVFDGPEPVLALAADEAAEIAAVTDWLRACLADGIAETELAVLRGQAQLTRGRAAVKAAGATISVVTMHDAKGLEFRGVAAMALDEDVLPDPGRLEELGDAADLEAIQDAERHLLYVAATRARDRLMLSGVAPGSEFLDDLR